MRARDLLQYRKDPRVVIALPVLIVIVTSGVYYLIQRAKELSPEALSSRLLLFVLWNINLILIIGIVFVLLRGVVKLLLERKRGLLGSRFRSRLVATYLATSLVPIILLFLVATDLLRVSIDRWFTAPVQRILRNSDEIARMAQDQATDKAAAAAAAAAAEISGGGSLAGALERVREAHRVQLIGIYRDGALVTMRADPRAPAFEAADPPAAFFETVATEGSATKIDVGLRGKWLRAGAAAPEDSVVVAGVFLPAEASRMLDENIIAFSQFQQLDTQKEAFKTSQTSLFLAITLSILFGTLWTAMYASRRITGPVVALAEGTRTLAEGKLGHRITLEASDEFKLLIDSFNRMADEIESKREALTRSNVELQRVNARLDQERAYLATVLESVSTGILAIGPDGEVLSANQAALRILELEDDPVGRQSTEVLSGSLEAVGEAVADRAGEGRAREVSIVRDGEVRYLEIAVAPLQQADAPGGVVVAMEDLTRLVQAQKLAAWSEAARRIAHEIKNPLTPIQLNAERLLRKAADESVDLRPVTERACATIIGEVQQLKRMVDEFSRFARMPAVHLRHTSLSEVLEPAVELYRNVKPSVEIRLRVDPGLEALLDPEQIRRAVINLIDNAVEATDEGLIEVDACRSDGLVTIGVSDSGRGVPPGDKDKLFTPYFSTKQRGTGLGLAIVNRIVHDHDGRICVYDNKPRGTRFEIELPA